MGENYLIKETEFKQSRSGTQSHVIRLWIRGNTDIWEFLMIASGEEESTTSLTAPIWLRTHFNATVEWFLLKPATIQLRLSTLLRRTE